LRSRSAPSRPPSTTLTCIDWLADGLRKVCARWNPITHYRDRDGHLRAITVEISESRLIARSFEKTRQSARGMPAIMIRQLDALSKITAYATTAGQ
jgi:uncharacterized membrane protein